MRDSTPHAPGVEASTCQDLSSCWLRLRTAETVLEEIADES
jgi:hypothetical protein